jgi:ABC-2 type transport system ATP-binding protein
VGITILTGHGVATAAADARSAGEGSSSAADGPAAGGPSDAARPGGKATAKPDTSRSSITKRAESSHPSGQRNESDDADGPATKRADTSRHWRRDTSPSKSATTPKDDTRTDDTVTDPAGTTPDPGPNASILALQSISSTTKRPPSPSGPTNMPVVWMTMAAARREIGVDSTAAAAAKSGPIAYVPNPTLVADPASPLSGVITSSVDGTDANGRPLSYVLVSGPSAGGKIGLDAATGTFTYLPDASVLTSATHTESFRILVHEVTPFVSSLEPLLALPIVGSLVDQALVNLYQIPVLNTLLAPIIGASQVAKITVDLDEVDPGGNPIAYTTMLTSFDGTQISTNWFPALGLQAGGTAPTLLNGPGLGGRGNIDPSSVIDFSSMSPGLAPLRAAGYNVVTWDPRGEFASGGVLQFDNPNFEGKDLSVIIDWVATLPETQLDGPGDPRMGMVGGSYGGGIQLVTAALDHRIDAIVPTVAWHSLTDVLYPNQTFKTAFDALILLGLTLLGVNSNPRDYSGFLTGAALGVLSPADVRLIASSGPGDLVSQIKAPTLLIQGTADVLVPLNEAMLNAQLLSANGVPVKMIWFCGGHGVCLDPVDRAAEANSILADQLAWLDQYVKENGTPADNIPRFQWIDQLGNFYSSDVMPFEAGFQGEPVTASGAGGLLPIVPLKGGSGPQAVPPGSQPGLEYTLASRADSAINLTVPVAAGTQIVGAPQVSFSYAGLGTSRALYAQIVDEDTGRVLGNIVTPIPVTLDGQTHTVTLSMGQLADVAYTAPTGGGTLTVQLTGSATAFANVTAVGAVNVWGMKVALPTVAPGVALPASASALALSPVA